MTLIATKLLISIVDTTPLHELFTVKMNDIIFGQKLSSIAIVLLQQPCLVHSTKLVTLLKCLGKRRDKRKTWLLTNYINSLRKQLVTTMDNKNFVANEDATFVAPNSESQQNTQQAEMTTTPSTAANHPGPPPDYFTDDLPPAYQVAPLR